MEQVVVKGVAYTKASSVARTFGYTSDYVGQLCRKHKVRCELVGRTWFVEKESLAEHKRGRYKKTTAKSARKPAAQVPDKSSVKKRSDEKTSNSKVALKHDDKKYRIAVHAREHKATIHTARKSHHFSNRVTWNAPVYEPDQGELLPSLLKTEHKTGTEAVKLAVQPAEARKVTIKEEGAHQAFKPTELPKIPLNGTLRVKSYDEEVEVAHDEKSLKDNVFPQSQVQLKNPGGVIALTKQMQFTPRSVLDKQRYRDTAYVARASRLVEADVPVPDQVTFDEEFQEPLAQDRRGLSGLALFGISLTLAVVSAFAVLNLTSSTVATSQQAVDTISIDTSSIKHIWND